jgi:hypothetical protein
MRAGTDAEWVELEDTQGVTREREAVDGLTVVTTLKYCGTLIGQRTKIYKSRGPNNTPLSVTQLINPEFLVDGKFSDPLTRGE